MTTASIRLHILLSLLVAVAIPCRAQEVTRVPSEVTCASCRILLDSVVVLDGRREANVGRPLAIGYMSDGRILLTPEFDIAFVAAFDDKGRFLRRVGRQGEGPGEFGAVGQIKVGRGDTVRIYDHLNPQVSTFTSDLEFLETRGMTVPVGGGGNGLVELPDGRLVTQRRVPLVAHAGFPVHILSQRGEILRSFGAETDNPSYRLAQNRLMWRSVVPDSEDQLWIAPTTQYQVELWDLSGRMLRKLIRGPDWFPPHPDKGLGRGAEESREPPDPGIIGLWKDRDALLWVLILVADDDWEEGLGPVTGLRGPTTGTVDYRRYWDTIVEVLDPEEGALIASERFDHYLGMMTAISPTGQVVSYEEDEEGFPFVRVWQLRLSKKGR